MSRHGPVQTTTKVNDLLGPFEANQIIRQYKLSQGIPLDAWPPPVVNNQPPRLGSALRGRRCEVCGFEPGTGVLRLDMPVGHPDFGRLVRCHRCNDRHPGEERGR